MTADPAIHETIRGYRREALARHTRLLGLDFVEVVALEPFLVLRLSFVPSAHPLKAARPAALSPSAVRVVADRDGAPIVEVDSLTEDAASDFQLLVETRHRLAQASGSGSREMSYRVDLIDVPDIDPFFRSARWKLHVGESVALDCAFALPPSAAVEPAPEIDYLARDFERVRALMLDRMSVLLPDWQPGHPADAMVTVVEALAHAVDHLAYHQDAVATEAYLETARRRVSVRRHVRLLDYVLHEGVSARVWVQFEVTLDSLVLPAGSQLFTSVAGVPAAIAPGSEEHVHALAQAPEFFETLHAAELHAAHNRLSFHTWGARALWLPKGATSATFLAPDALLEPGAVLVLEELVDPETGHSYDADPNRRHVVRLTRVMPRIDPLLPPLPGAGGGGLAVVDIEWHAQDALPFALCLATVVNGQTLADVSVARGNVVLADHGRTLTGQSLVPEVVAREAARPYRPRLERTGIAYAVPYGHRLARTHSAASALSLDPRQAVPAVELTATPPVFESQGAGAEAAVTEIWRPVCDLLSSDRFAREFVVEMESDRSASLRFGDGARGRMPLPGTRFSARYRVAGSAHGNVGSESITHVISENGAIRAAIERVRNPLAARGGLDPEPLERARLHAPHAFRSQERCVTTEDYVALAARHPEVARCAAVRRWAGSFAVTVLAVERKGRPGDQRFHEDVRTYLESSRVAGAVLEIRAPRYVPLFIDMRVRVRDDAFRSTVRQALFELFGDRELASGERGFFHHDNYGFGDTIFLSHVLTAARAVAGVEWVAALAFGRMREARSSGGGHESSLDRGRIDIGPLEIARLHNDPSAPEFGTMQFSLEGGL